MTYAISDLHGYPLDRFLKLLEKASFCDDDDLYILGDVIDRNGDGGIALLRWMMEQPNVHLIMGNHEAMLLSCDFLFTEINDDSSITELTGERTELVLNYSYNGGDITLNELRALKNKSPEAMFDIIDYIRCAPLFEGITVGENDYILLHGGMDNFSQNKKLREYSPEDILWARPMIDEDYFDGVTVILGHTPTALYGIEYTDKIVKTRTWIDIDMGAGFGHEPVLLRLDDMSEFRNEKEK